MKTINVKNRKNAVADLKQIKSKKYVLADIKFENVHLRDINALLERNIFSKNDFYANTISLWELMQPQGKRGVHNHHDLTPEDIIDTLASITEPYCILKTEISQYAIMSTSKSHFGEPLFVIIEINSGLVEDKKANINKLVTMFPKRDIEKTIRGRNPKDVLYVNPKQNPHNQ